MTDQFPVLQGRRNPLIDNQRLDAVRGVLWRAFQEGSLSEQEFASTMERLEFVPRVLEPSQDSSPRG